MTDKFDYIELAEYASSEEWAQANALIAIAKELRTIRQYYTSPPVVVSNDPEYLDHISQCGGCISETEYPYGRQV